jgi:hypothetical protein
MAKKLILKKASNGNGNGKKDLVKAKLSRYLCLGLSLKEACKCANVTNTMLGVLQTDPDFQNFIEACEAKNKADNLESIKNAGQWSANAWILERVYPDQFGKKDLIKHEYTIKLQTLTKIFLDIINQESPQIRHRIVQKLRSYNFTGENILGDHNFKALPEPVIDVDYEEN